MRKLKEVLGLVCCFFYCLWDAWSRNCKFWSVLPSKAHGRYPTEQKLIPFLLLLGCLSLHAPSMLFLTWTNPSTDPAVVTRLWHSTAVSAMRVSLGDPAAFTLFDTVPGIGDLTYLLSPSQAQEFFIANCVNTNTGLESGWNQ